MELAQINKHIYICIYLQRKRKGIENETWDQT